MLSLPDAPKASKPLAKRIRQHAAIETWLDSKTRLADVKLSGGLESTTSSTCLRTAKNSLQKPCLSLYAAKGRRFGCHWSSSARGGLVLVTESL